MSTINVFEMAFMQNANLNDETVNKSDAQKVTSKALSESIIKSSAKTTKESIKLNKLRFTEDIDDIDIQPSEDVVVVYSDKINPEMSADEVEKAAEELIGATICKCGICGANYIADDNHSHDDESDVDEVIEDSILFTNEDDDTTDKPELDDEIKESLIFTEADVDSFEVDTELSEDADTEENDSDNIESKTICPVCNAEESQVEVGVIASNEETESTDTEDTESDDESNADESDDDNSDDDVSDDESDDKDADDESDESDKDDESDDAEDVNEGLFGKKDKQLYDVWCQYEGEKWCAVEGVSEKEADKEIKKAYDDNDNAPGYKAWKEPHKEGSSLEPSQKVNESIINFKERAFNVLLNKFARENYKNIKSVRITEGKSVDGELVFEGVVNTFKGNTIPVEFKTVKFAYNEGVLKLKMTETGPFTESAQLSSNRVPFVVECISRNGIIVPKVLKCKYNVKTSDGLFECYGKYSLSKNDEFISEGIFAPSLNYVMFNDHGNWEPIATFKKSNIKDEFIDAYMNRYGIKDRKAFKTVHAGEAKKLDKLLKVDKGNAVDLDKGLPDWCAKYSNKAVKSRKDKADADRRYQDAKDREEREKQWKRDSQRADRERISKYGSGSSNTGHAGVNYSGGDYY